MIHTSCICNLSSTAALDSSNLIDTHALFSPATKERMPAVSSYKLRTPSPQIVIFKNASGLPLQRSAKPPHRGKIHGQVETAVKKSFTQSLRLLFQSLCKAMATTGTLHHHKDAIGFGKVCTSLPSTPGLTWSSALL